MAKPSKIRRELGENEGRVLMLDFVFVVSAATSICLLSMFVDVTVCFITIVLFSRKTLCVTNTLPLLRPTDFKNSSDAFIVKSKQAVCFLRGMVYSSI